MIAGEEPELCMRLRQAGGKIMRIDADMTLHDAQITRFGQWWKRSVRSGLGFAQGAWLTRCNRERLWAREAFRSWFWALLLPGFAIATLLPTKGLSIVLLLMIYTLLAYRVYRCIKLRGFPTKDAIFYALFCVLEKYPQLLGQIQFHILRLLKRQRTIVEYKSTISAS